MRNQRYSIWLVVCVLTQSVGIAGAQVVSETDDSRPTLRGKHRIEIGLGLLTELSTTAEVFASDVTTSSDSDGLVGSLSYTHYAYDDVALGVCVGVLDAQATTTVQGGRSHVVSAAVVPVLFGVKVQPSSLALGTVVRPYASVALGPYVGSVSDVRSGPDTLVEAFTETALGARFGLGVDFFVGRYFTWGVGGGYHVVSEFDRPIGSTMDYSGPELSLTVGIALGGS